MFTQLNLEMTINKIKAQEEHMLYEKQRKSIQPSLTLTLTLGLREVQTMICVNSKLEQYSAFNCYDPYDPDLYDQHEKNLSLSAQNYL